MHRRSFLAGLATATIAGCQSPDVEGTFRVPEAVLVDERFDVRLDGLPSNTPVRVTARAEDGHDYTSTWTASATFHASEEGTVSLAEQPPLSGSYEGVDPMGLFWSMRNDAPAAEAFFPPHDHELTLAASVDGERVASSTIARRLAVDGVEATRLDELVGTVFTPPGGSAGPGVLLLPGSGRSELTARARVLASRGFVACSLQYFGRPDALPDVLADVPVEYAQRGVERLLAHPRTAGDQVAVWGISKGAELALLLGSHDDRVGAVVGVSPSTAVWEGFDDDGRPVGTSSWTIDGEPVPYIPLADFEDVPGDPTESPRSFYEYSELRAAPERIAEATIPVERIRGPVMLFSGTDDNQWHSTAMADRAVDRLAEHDHAFEYDHRAFDGAGHSMPIPYLPTYGSSASPSYSLGGGPVANARASREHWTEAVETLAGADDGFEAEQPPVEPEPAAQPSGEELLTRAAWLLAGGVGAVALVAVALLVAFGPTTAKSRFLDGPVATYKRTASWAWTRDESDRTSSKNTLLFTAVMYATALGLVLLAGGVLVALQYRSVATPLLVFGIWFTTFVGSMNVAWELLQLRAARRASGTDGRGDDGPRRELAPEFRPSRDAKIGFVVTVVALGALLLSFRLAVALTRLF